MSDTHIRDWKHLWLNTSGWEALGVWLDARWYPLDPQDRLAFALQVTGFPAEWSISFDEHGELIDDIMLAVETYANDPEIPRHMIEPFVYLGGGPF